MDAGAFGKRRAAGGEREVCEQGANLRERLFAGCRPLREIAVTRREAWKFSGAAPDQPSLARMRILLGAVSVSLIRGCWDWDALECVAWQHMLLAAVTSYEEKRIAVGY